MMTYEEFLETELCGELTGILYEPEHGVVYGTSNIGFTYNDVSYYPGARIAYHLDDGTMRYRSM